MGHERGEPREAGTGNRRLEQGRTVVQHHAACHLDARRPAAVAALHPLRARGHEREAEPAPLLVVRAAPGELMHDETIAELLAIFDRHATSGTRDGGDALRDGRDPRPPSMTARRTTR